MPKLKIVRDNLDDVPDALKAFYVEKDEVFTLDLEGIDNHPEVINLKTAHQKVKTKNTTLTAENTVLKSKVAALPEDFDPEEFERLKAMAEELDKDPDRKNAIEAVRRAAETRIAALEKKQGTEVATRDEQINAGKAFIRKLLVDDGLNKALIEVGVAKEFFKAAKAVLRENIKVIEEEGEYRAAVETALGEVTVEKFVQDWAAGDEGKVFVAPAKGGGAGGSDKNSRATDGINPWDPKTFNLTQQGLLIKADRPKAERLAAAVGVAL